MRLDLGLRTNAILRHAEDHAASKSTQVITDKLINNWLG